MPSDGEREYERLRRMTPAQKLTVMRSLIRRGYEFKAAGIRARSPELSEREVREEVREIVSRDRT